ncbi:Spherulation-specific family 4-domain-containing protein [Phaeosphaeria sp. MPI-PUGE-AT-0046c]|nr:Spherulation-specific family 4-domain-containing protein [Phaeosphaeria sp. MPI-PUGE-AT-0046c]
MSYSTPAIPLLDRPPRPPSPSRRNSSNPYSLAIPARSQRRTTFHRADTPTQYLDPPSDPITRRGTPYLEIPKSTIVVTGRPRPYTLNGASSSSISRPYVPREKAEPSRKINDRVLAWVVTLSLAILLSIGIPLGVILPQKLIKPLPINVLVPFYLKPEEGSWRKLEDAIVKHHTTNFTVVVNPNNGPGNATWPAATYINAVKSINLYPNVKTLGYIDVANATMPNATVRAQIATYAGWGNVSEELAIHGIFFDRAPWKSDKDGLIERYMRNVSATVRSEKGWAGEADGLVAYNAGRLPGEELMALQPNLTVVFEGIYSELPDQAELAAQLRKTNTTRENFAMLVNSTPGNLGRGGLRRIVERIRKDVEWFIAENPSLQFLVIVNPNSGPGAAPWWPNEDYVREVPQLSRYSNVQIVGYVRATYCQRGIANVFDDIETYAKRAKSETGGLQLQGIFVDETANVYSPVVKQYLDQIDQKVKMVGGVGGNRLTIHNPGTAVNKELAEPGPDITVVVETSYSHFVTKEYQEWLATSPYNRSRTCYMLHSVPQDMVADLTATLCDKAEYLFITSATERFYEGFNESWKIFIAAITAQ